MESFKHTHDATCPSCENKLTQAHAYLRDWFHGIKAKYQSAHVSWSYRDKADQEAAFQSGKTKLHYPKSAHNLFDENLMPRAMALDLFQIDEDGVARWAKDWFSLIAKDCAERRLPIFWGGHWQHLGDLDHFELQFLNEQKAT